jgi:hypothetical protein
MVAWSTRTPGSVILLATSPAASASSTIASARSTSVWKS